MLDRIVVVYRALPERIRFALTRLALSATIAVATSFAVQLGVYSFAFRHGARIPLEGVSFIAFSGGIVAFALAVTSLFLFEYVPREVRGFQRKAVETDAEMEAHFRSKRLLINGTILAMFVGLSLLTVLGHAAAQNVFVEVSEREDLWSIALQYVPLAAFVCGVMALAYNFSPADTRWHRVLVWVFGIAIAAALYAVLSWPFDSFLRAIRYGGGIRVEFIFNSEKVADQCLFLISDQYVTVYDDSSASFDEYPRTQVTQFRYGAVESPCELPLRIPREDKPPTTSG